MSEMPILLKFVAFMLFVAIVFVVLNAVRREHRRRVTPRRRFGCDVTAASDNPSLWVVGSDSGPSHKHHGHHGHHHADISGGGHQGSHGGDHSHGGFDGGHSSGGFDGGGHAGGGH
jgi:uncharacterized membrane protein YgcG